MPAADAATVRRRGRRAEFFGIGVLRFIRRDLVHSGSPISRLNFVMAQAYRNGKQISRDN
jgi:hypothetical protein